MSAIEGHDWRSSIAVYSDPHDEAPAYPRAATEATKPTDRSPAEASLVVAIGAGEGGRAALEALFIALDEGADMAFVVIQHGQRGDPLTPAALAQFTELHVRELASGDRPEPDHVYLAPPGVAVELESNRFVLTRLAEPRARRTLVDTLFRSVAGAVGPRAVGIVLSGAGSDGSIGVQSIARAGGLTLVHDPSRAKASGMPRSAIASGVIDHVLSPFEMAEKLVTRSGRGAPPPLAAISRSDLAQILSGLQVVNTELKRFNRELLTIHGKLHGNVQELQLSLAALQAQNEALTRAHSNLSSLLSHAPVAVLVLDEALNVRGFTRDADHVYDLKESDIGLPIAAIEHRAHDMPPLPTLAELRDAQRAHEDDVVTEDRWYLRRVLPHHARHGEVDGMVVTFIDVTRLKSSEANARPHEAWLRSVIDGMPAIISFVDEAVARG